jgi:hypothetical protein
MKVFHWSVAVANSSSVINAEEFHARSLAALESTRGLRDDAFLKLESCAGVGDDAFVMRSGEGR